MPDVSRGYLADRPALAVVLAEQLTPRERWCLSYLSVGCTTKQTGAALGVSASTVATHVSHAVAKLCAKNRTHAVALAIRHGLIR